MPTLILPRASLGTPNCWLPFCYYCLYCCRCWRLPVKKKITQTLVSQRRERNTEKDQIMHTLTLSLRWLYRIIGFAIVITVIFLVVIRLTDMPRTTRFFIQLYGVSPALFQWGATSSRHLNFFFSAVLICFDRQFVLLVLLLLTFHCALWWYCLFASCYLCIY